MERARIGAASMKDLLQFIMEGGSVVRYHTRPGIKPDTDARHSHGVAMLCSILAGSGPEDKRHTLASSTLLMAALTHDLAEQKTGDMSAPAKRALGMGEALGAFELEELRKYNLEYERFLDEEERTILKLADCFDGMMYCCREAALGNRNVRLIWTRYCEYVVTLTSAEPAPLDLVLRASNMFESIKEIYKEVTSTSGPDFDVFS